MEYVLFAAGAVVYALPMVSRHREEIYFGGWGVFGYPASLALVAWLASMVPALAGMPPTKYDKPYKGELSEWRVPLGRAASKCNALARDLGEPATNPLMIGGRSLYGCAYPYKGECFIVYSYDPSGKEAKMADNVRRHEVAHCNGWPAHHPGQRP